MSTNPGHAAAITTTADAAVVMERLSHVLVEEGLWAQVEHHQDTWTLRVAPGNWFQVSRQGVIHHVRWQRSRLHPVQHRWALEQESGDSITRVAVLAAEWATRVSRRKRQPSLDHVVAALLDPDVLDATKSTPGATNGMDKAVGW